MSLSRSQSLVLILLLGAVLAVAGKRLAAGGTAQGPGSAAPLAEAPSPAVAAAPARLVVHVVGAVRRVGLYRLAEGSRVADAVARAGGMTRRAEVAAVNLAAPLADGQQVIVPARIAPGAESTAVTGGKVSLAVATVEDLDELPGIGPVTAQRIVDWRQAYGPFRSVEDLDGVPGIGPARVEQLRDLVSP